MNQMSISALTLNMIVAGLIAGTTSTLSTGSALGFSIHGKGYTHPALTNAVTPTVDAQTQLPFNPILPNTGCTFLVGISATGVLGVTQSNAYSLDANGNFPIPPQIPEINDVYCPIGYIVVRAGSAASANGWIFGTNSFAGVTGITTTIQDLIGYPDRPQAS